MPPSSVAAYTFRGLTWSTPKFWIRPPNCRPEVTLLELISVTAEGAVKAWATTGEVRTRATPRLTPVVAPVAITRSWPAIARHLALKLADPMRPPPLHARPHPQCAEIQPHVPLSGRAVNPERQFPLRR